MRGGERPIVTNVTWMGLVGQCLGWEEEEGAGLNWAAQNGETCMVRRLQRELDADRCN